MFAEMLSSTDTGAAMHFAEWIGAQVLTVTCKGTLRTLEMGPLGEPLRRAGLVYDARGTIK